MSSPVKMEDVSLRLGSVIPRMTVETGPMKEILAMKRLVLTISSLVQAVDTASLSPGSAMETTTALIRQMNKTVRQ